MYFTPCCYLQFIFWCHSVVLTCESQQQFTVSCTQWHTSFLSSVIFFYSAHNFPMIDETITCVASISFNSIHLMAEYFFFHSVYSFAIMPSLGPRKKRKKSTNSHTYKHFRVLAVLLLLLAVKRHVNRFTTMTSLRFPSKSKHVKGAFSRQTTCLWLYWQTAKLPSSDKNAPKPRRHVGGQPSAAAFVSFRLQAFGCCARVSNCAAGVCWRYKAVVHLGDGSSSKPARWG